MNFDEQHDIIDDIIAHSTVSLMRDDSTPFQYLAYTCPCGAKFGGSNGLRLHLARMTEEELTAHHAMTLMANS